MFYYAKIVINGEGGVDKNLSEGISFLQKYIKNVPEDKWIEGTKELIDSAKLTKKIKFMNAPINIWRSQKVF